MNPCGSGQRLCARASTTSPGYGKTNEAHDWSYGRKDFPLYCTHCSFMNEKLPIEWSGYPLYPSHPPKDFDRTRASGTGTRTRRTSRPSTGTGTARSSRSGRRVRRASSRVARRGIGASDRRSGCATTASRSSTSIAPTARDLQLDVAPASSTPDDFAAFDVVVSNAAITTTIAPAHRMTPEQWQRDIDVNLTGAFRVVQAALPGMRKRGYGRIVAISSGAAARGLPGQVAYAASKAGLLGMVRTIAAENAGKGITANAVLPGMIATEQVRAMPPAVVERVMTTMPTGRLGDPDEIAGLVAYLVSENAGYLTGQAIEVDGALGLNTMSLGGKPNP